MCIYVYIYIYTHIYVYAQRCIIQQYETIMAMRCRSAIRKRYCFAGSEPFVTYASAPLYPVEGQVWSWMENFGDATGVWKAARTKEYSCPGSIFKAASTYENWWWSARSQPVRTHTVVWGTVAHIYIYIYIYIYILLYEALLRILLYEAHAVVQPLQGFSTHHTMTS